MIRLHQFEISPYCDKIRRALHWKRLPYEIVEVPLSKAQSVRRINRVGKLPTLEHDGRWIADSTDIAQYLERMFPEPPLLPKDPQQRALCHVLEDWADESLYFYEMRLRFSLPHNAARWIPVLTAHDPPWMKRLARFLVPRLMGSVLSRQGIGRKPIDVVLRETGEHVRALEDWLAGRDWLVGDALSIADLAVFGQLFAIGGSEEGAGILAASSAVTSWMARVDAATARPTAP
jgi:glutathione S-transferase